MQEFRQIPVGVHLFNLPADLIVEARSWLAKNPPDPIAFKDRFKDAERVDLGTIGGSAQRP